MIDGKKVRLRPWREDDLRQLTDMRNDIMLQSQLLSRVRGSNCEQTRQWLQQRCKCSNNLLFIIADKKTDIFWGYIQFTEIELVNRHAKIGICLDFEFQGKGMGSEILSLSLKYLHDAFGIHKVFLEVRADNDQAIHCYKKVGFKTCGKFHKHFFIDGKWYDLVLMEIFLNSLGDTP